jgi:hypothetical protein
VAAPQGFSEPIWGSVARYFGFYIEATLGGIPQSRKEGPLWFQLFV